MTGTDVDLAVQSILQDGARAHWALTDLYQWIYEAEIAHAQNAPRSVTRTVNIDLAGDAASQTLSASYTTLLDVTQNMGADGATPGKTITYCSMDRLRASVPKWRTDKAAQVRHFMRDERDPRAFFVWPTPLDSIRVEAVVMAKPVKLADLATSLTVRDDYLGSMADYVLHRAYAQDAEDSQNANLAAMHFAAFANKLGIKIQNSKAASPARNSGDTPAYPAVDKNGI